MVLANVDIPTSCLSPGSSTRQRSVETAYLCHVWSPTEALRQAYEAGSRVTNSASELSGREARWGGPWRAVVTEPAARRQYKTAHPNWKNRNNERIVQKWVQKIRKNKLKRRFGKKTKDEILLRNAIEERLVTSKVQEPIRNEKGKWRHKLGSSEPDCGFRSGGGTLSGGRTRRAEWTDSRLAGLRSGCKTEAPRPGQALSGDKCWGKGADGDQAWRREPGAKASSIQPHVSTPIFCGWRVWAKFWGNKSQHFVKLWDFDIILRTVQAGERAEMCRQLISVGVLNSWKMNSAMRNLEIEGKSRKVKQVGRLKNVSGWDEEVRKWMDFGS